MLPTCAVLFCVFLWNLFNWLPQRKKTHWTLEVRPAGSLLTRTERDFYSLLQPLLPQGTHLCMKVRLIDVVRPARRWDPTCKNKLIQKHVNFVLLEGGTLRPILVIELDDKSHEGSQRAKADRLKDEALRQSGIPFERVEVSGTYDLENLQRRIQESLVAA